VEGRLKRVLEMAGRATYVGLQISPPLSFLLFRHLQRRRLVLYLFLPFPFPISSFSS
jgi:hypothetical protein